MARPTSIPRRLAPEDLPDKVKDLLTNRVDKTVFVKADSRARYEKVVDVVDNLRAAGVDQLGLLTEQMQDKNRPAGEAAPRRPGRPIGFYKGAILWEWQSADPVAVRKLIST